MRTPVFKRSDFVLCHVPVPEGYPQSQTHAGVGVLSNGQYVLTSSPFPAVKYNILIAYMRAGIRRLTKGKFFKHPGEYYENPCIYVGDPTNASPPSSFRLAQSTPLMNPVDPVFGYPSFNSDPDLYIEDDSIYILNRSIYRRGGKYNYFMRLFLINGRIENSFFLQNSTILFREGTDIVGSQCLIKFDGQYLMTDIMSNSYNDGVTWNGIRFIKGKRIEDLKSICDWNMVEVVNNGDFLPWHMSLFSCNNVLYTIIACVRKGMDHRCWQLLGEFSNDLSRLFIYQKPLTDYNSYRGAAIVCEDGNFILYNTTVGEKIKGGKSVDGREIVMAQMPFSELLDLLRKSEKYE